MDAYDAIVLAGGSARRLGGIDKASLEVGESTLLFRALAAVSGARTVVVVGPMRHVPESVLVVSEEPPGGGPVAALAAGLKHMNTSVVVVLACDMPFVTTQTVDQLVAAASTSDHGALLIDPGGRQQYLTAAYRVAALESALDRLESVDGAAMKQALQPLTLIEIASDADITLDCDAWDVERSPQILENR